MVHIMVLWYRNIVISHQILARLARVVGPLTLQGVGCRVYGELSQMLRMFRLLGLRSGWSQERELGTI